MTKLEYLTARWHEVKALRDRKANEIAQLTSDGDWLMRRDIPGYAIIKVSQYVGHCRILVTSFPQPPLSVRLVPMRQKLPWPQVWTHPSRC